MTRKDFEALQRYGVFRAERACEDGFVVDGQRRYSALLAGADNLKAVSENCLGDRLKKRGQTNGRLFHRPA